MFSDFLEQGSHLAKQICVSWHTGSRKLKMAANKSELLHISGGSCDRIKIPTAIPMLLRMRNSNTAVRTSGSYKSNMAAAKPEIPHIAGGRRYGTENTTYSDFINTLEQIVLQYQPK